MTPRPSRYFIGRKDLLDLLAERLRPGAPRLGHVTLQGLDGVGKSETAAAFLHAYGRRYAAFEWVRASSERSLASGYDRIAAKHGLMAGGREPGDRVRAWFENRQDCLLVLDDVPDPELLGGFLPDPGISRVLITSRYAAWREVGSTFPVEPLDQDAATGYLLARTKQTDGTAAGVLASELGSLPLALKQATERCIDSGLALHEYAQRLQDDLEATLGLGRGTTGGGRTVANVWTTSLRAVRRHMPAAGELLSILSFLAPERLEQADLRPVQDLLTSPGDDEHTTRDGLVHRLLGDLGCHSLVYAEPPDMVSVHRLVQAVVRASMSTPERCRWAEAAVKLVAAAFPVEVGRQEQREACQRLAVHARAAAAHARALGVGLQAAAGLLARVDRYQGHASG